MQKEFINWEETEKLIKTLGERIQESGFTPTMIAPVPRGGWCVAAILAQIFDIKKTLGISHKKENGDVKVLLSINDLKGENILLIEDTIETGRTFFAIEKELIKRGANVKTACLFVSATSKSEQEKKPDFYLGTRELPDFVWEL
ncbi:phosphoribosyltransferase [Candidatus Saccharibacteria bacterium]|nr:phosphoribosyltransferase [Candidatus Saccharibacteria bacterium]